MRHIKACIIFVCLGIMVSAALMMLAGCLKSESRPLSEESHFSIGKLLLLPIQNGTQRNGEDQVVRCPVCGTSYMTGPVQGDHPEVFLTEQLKEMLKQRKVRLLSLSTEEYEEVRTRVVLGMKGGGERQILAAVGREMGADTVMIGTLYLFKKRIGSAYAADSPASVGFHLDLIDVKNSSVVWSRVFEETQRALSENLLTIGQFFKRKGKWLTAKALAVSGLEKILKTFPAPPGE